MIIFVSSLSFKAKKEDLVQLFATYGEVTSARIIHDKATRRSKGYGFVEMENQEQAMAAIAALNAQPTIRKVEFYLLSSYRACQGFLLYT